MELHHTTLPGEEKNSKLCNQEGKLCRVFWDAEDVILINFFGALIKNMLTRSKDCNIYPRTVTRHRWSRQIMMKIDKWFVAFIQHCGFHQLKRKTLLLITRESPVTEQLIL